MKIDIKSESFHMKLVVPSSLVFNRCMAWLWKRLLRKEFSEEISGKEWRKLLRTVRKMVRRYRGMPLVEVEEKSGDHVYIFF